MEKRIEGRGTSLVKEYNKMAVRCNSIWSSISAAHLSHVVGNVQVHVDTNNEPDEVLRQRKVLVDDSKMQRPEGRRRPM